jgi:RNA polymerase sigma-70 factor (ECF subfamily)
MTDRDWLAQQFEQNRGHLRAVAYRMLGSVSEADDAIQETWLRLSRSDAAEIENLGGWLTTVIARVCLDMLRSRTSRREEALEEIAEPVAVHQDGSDPENEAVLADSVGLALLVVLDRLEPAERLAFVMHDMFGLPFEEIASMVGRSPAATRQLASRARRRVQGPPAGHSEISKERKVGEQRKVVDAFLAAMRVGDFEGLLAVLDPDVLVHIDTPTGPREIRGARNWAQGAITFSHAIQFTRAALVDGSVGLVWAPRGHLYRALKFTISGGKIVHVDIVADPARLRDLNLAVLAD